jgi:hypothetical protein
MSVCIENCRILFFRGNQKTVSCWAPMGHNCNPRYSRGRDQEDHGLKSARMVEWFKV